MRTMLVVALAAALACKAKDEARPAPTGSGSGSSGSAVAVVADASRAIDAVGSAGPDGGSDADAAVVQKPLGGNVMSEETIGGLKIGSSSVAVIDALAAPAKRTKPEEVPATGDIVSTWTWPGVTLDMKQQKDETFVVLSIAIKAPSQLATSRGVHIGSPKADVKQHYRHSKEGGDDDPNAFLVGSPYGAYGTTNVMWLPVQSMSRSPPVPAYMMSWPAPP